MKMLGDLSTSQLHKIVALKEQIEALNRQIDSITGRSEPLATPQAKGKRHMSASARAKIATAQRARWARVKGTAAKARSSKKKDGRNSPAFRAKMAAAAKARWKKAKAEGKTSL
jgi:hypothetical protein